MSTVARIVARNVAPIHEHDCSACTFLGRLDGDDLYHCPNFGGALIARHSSRPSDNGSFGLDMRLAPAKGTPYALALALYALGASRKVGTHAYVTKQATRSEMRRMADLEADAYKAKRAAKAVPIAECNGCEHCDGEGGPFGPGHPRVEFDRV